MLLSDYGGVYVLLLDKKYYEDALRIQGILCKNGVKSSKIYEWITGNGEFLPQKFYTTADQIIDKHRPDHWYDGPGAFRFTYNFKKIIENAVYHNLDHILFCEDDLIFTDDFAEVLTKASPEIPEDWDIIYYGVNHSSHEVSHVTENVLKLHGGYTTHCMGIRNTVFQALLDLPFNRVMDYMISEQIIPKFNCYSIWPNIALQKPGMSNLQNVHVDYTSYFKVKGKVRE